MVSNSKNCKAKRNRGLPFLGIFLFLWGMQVAAQQGDGARAVVGPSLVVRADRPGPAIQPTMWGIFFEDINMAADGGLYAELVKNRSFEFNSPLMGWAEHTTAPGDGTILVLNQSAENAKNPRFIRVSHFSDKPYGL